VILLKCYPQWVKLNMKIIYITGIDGSGKTTLAKNLEASLQNTERKARYFYARHFPILMLPLKFLARATFLHGTSQFGNYKVYIEKKKSQARKHRWLARFYAFIWFVDYFLLTYIRLFPHFVTRRSLILDRYFFDTVINMCIMLDLPESKFLRLVNIFAKLFPSPEFVFYLDLPATVAFQRKDDIQSLQYLEERQECYRVLVRVQRWITIDATRTVDQVKAEVLSHLANASRQ
jgi:thymidylate kinase